MVHVKFIYFRSNANQTSLLICPLSIDLHLSLAPCHTFQIVNTPSYVKLLWYKLLELRRLNNLKYRDYFWGSVPGI